MRAEDDRAAGWVDRFTNPRLHGTIGSAPSTESSNPYTSGGEFGAQSRGDEVMGGLGHRSALAAGPLGPFLEGLLRPLSERKRGAGLGGEHGWVRSLRLSIGDRQRLTAR